MAKIVQKIPIMMENTINNQIASYNPTDNSLGIVEIDLTKYSDVTGIYVEYLCKYVPYGIPDARNCKIRLYDIDNGAEVAGSVITDYDMAGAGYWTVVRSDNILSYVDADADDKIQVVPQIKASGYEPYLTQCTIVILQTVEDVSETWKTRTYIPIGDKYNFTSTYQEVSNARRWLLDKDAYDGTITAYFECVAKIATANWGNVKIYNHTDGADVTGGEITIVNTSYTRQRTADIWANLIDAKEYTTWAETMHYLVPGSMVSSYLIIDQSGSLTKVETHLMTMNKMNSTLSIGYTGLGIYGGSDYNVAEWANCARVINVEYIHKVMSGGTVYAQSYDDGAAISNSEKTTNSVSWVRNKGVITEPPGDSLITVSHKTSDSAYQAFTSVGRLIITVTNMQDEVVGAFMTTNKGYWGVP